MTFRTFRTLVCTGVLALGLGWVADAADRPGAASGSDVVWTVAGTVDHDGPQFTSHRDSDCTGRECDEGDEGPRLLCPRGWPLPWCR